MLAPWVIDEVSTADLKDKRLKKRLAQVLSDLAARPTASIPAASGGRAEMVGAYRLIANEKTTFGNILQTHIEATRKRVAAQSVVIMAQDTSVRIHAGRDTAGNLARHSVGVRGRNGLCLAVASRSRRDPHRREGKLSLG